MKSLNCSEISFFPNVHDDDDDFLLSHVFFYFVKIVSVNEQCRKMAIICIKKRNLSINLETKESKFYEDEENK